MLVCWIRHFSVPSSGKLLHSFLRVAEFSNTLASVLASKWHIPGSGLGHASVSRRSSLSHWHTVQFVACPPDILHNYSWSSPDAGFRRNVPRHRKTIAMKALIGRRQMERHYSRLNTNSTGLCLQIQKKNAATDLEKPYWCYWVTSRSFQRLVENQDLLEIRTCYIANSLLVRNANIF